MQVLQTSTRENTLPPDCQEPPPQQPDDLKRLAAYLAAGIVFGWVLIQSQAVSWFRIQEMFLFDSFHLYGVIGSAVVTAAAGVGLLRRTSRGEAIRIAPKAWGTGRRYWIGGGLFGLGWGLLGACPAPILALIGHGMPVMIAALLSALAGTFLYGVLRPYLPH